MLVPSKEPVKLIVGDVFVLKKKRFLVLSNESWRFKHRLVELDNNYKNAYVCNDNDDYTNSYVTIIKTSELTNINPVKSHWSLLYSHEILARMQNLDYLTKYRKKINDTILTALYAMVVDPTEKNECIFIIECLKDKRMKKILSRKKILSVCREKSYKDAVSLLNFI